MVSDSGRSNGYVPVVRIYANDAHDAPFLIISILGTDAIGNPERHVRKASHRGSKQQ